MTKNKKDPRFSSKEWRMNNLYRIKTKDKKLVPLFNNKVQKHYRENETRRDAILKARQLGFTTWKLIDYFDDTITTPNTNTAIIAHERDKVTKLFEIVKRAYVNMKPEIRPVASFDNRNELYFPGLDSKIYVGLNTRSETVHNLHVSEVAYIRGLEDKVSDIFAAVPADGRISVETTANGMSGWFFDLWNDTKSVYKKHFYNWTWDGNYKTVTNQSMEELMDEYLPLSKEWGLIENVQERFNLSKEQLRWYIDIIRIYKRETQQEYPLTDLEAFISLGRNVFHIHDLQKHEAKDPIERKWGDLFIWEEPLKGFAYIIGCDPSEGIGQDNAAIEVLNAYTGEQVAEFATPYVAPDILAGYLTEIGNYYNKGLIVLEINNHGLAVLNAIKHKYWNIYRREKLDSRTKQYTFLPGWKTTGTSKPILVDNLEEAVRERSISINSRKCLSEMRTFVRSDEEGLQGFGAEGSNKDDRVIALGLCVQGMKYLPKMKKPKTVAQERLESYIKSKEQDTIPNPFLDRPKQRIRGIVHGDQT